MSELVVSSRDALAQALMEYECPPYYWGDEAVRDSYGDLVDHLLASGVVRALPDEEAVADAIGRSTKPVKVGAQTKHYTRLIDPGLAARAVLALFTEGARD